MSDRNSVTMMVERLSHLEKELGIDVLDQVTLA